MQDRIRRFLAQRTEMLAGVSHDLRTPLTGIKASVSSLRDREITLSPTDQESLGIARNTLADRLARLVEQGLLERSPYQTDPVRHDYLLTEKGRDFYPVLLAMSGWGDRWLSGEQGPPIVHYHAACGQEAEAAVVCGHCGKPMTAENTVSRMGPGYPPRLAERPEVRARFAEEAREGSLDG
jgi:DNA-binding HxlR family transcriptional regulator